MRAKICLPIIKQSIPEVLEIIEQQKNNFDMFEIWVDYLKENGEMIQNMLQDLSNNFAKKIIVVFRRQNAEPITMPFEKRKIIIEKLANKNIFLDLDLEQQTKDLEVSKEKKAKVIASFHDYKKTPRTSALVEIIKKMELFQPAIFKIATFCETEKDALHLLHLLLDLKEEKKDVIILGMGRKGLITRIFGSIWGNEIIFAPESSNEQSAPGQITKEQLEKIFSMINK